MRALWPGLLLVVLITLAAFGTASGEVHLLSAMPVETLVLAIALGIATRATLGLKSECAKGIDFSARQLLETAVVLLGASVDRSLARSISLSLLLAIVAAVALSIGIGFVIGRALRLSPTMALLVACGNSICGNSAIAAVAPVIKASREDVVAAIGFTAVAGVVLVIALPFVDHWLGFDQTQSGAFAGLTVYAVPQVLAATLPVGKLALQTGTMVKLMRVMMLGPVCATLSAGRGRASAARRPMLVPWFIIGFALLVALRLAGLVPAAVAQAASVIAGLLTVMSMAALGLSVDLAQIARSGPRVVAAASLSLLSLGAISWWLVRHLALG